MPAAIEKIDAQTDLDAVMESASEALAEMDYLATESLCLATLAEARRREDWPCFTRVLLPLQEARRQRRMIAADGPVMLGTPRGESLDTLFNDERPAGCVVVTRPADRSAAADLVERARLDRRHVEVLWADNEAEASQWVIRSTAGPNVSCTLPAPPAEWIGRWRTPQDSNEPHGGGRPYGKTPADWFLDAAERLGDAALATVGPHVTGVERINALADCLAVVNDHEILHQRLYDAARALRAAR